MSAWDYDLFIIGGGFAGPSAGINATGGVQTPAAEQYCRGRWGGSVHARENYLEELKRG